MSAALKWKMTFISALALLGLYASSPSIIYFSLPRQIRNDDQEFQKRVPAWLPRKHVKLGLDLQGGVQLVLGVTTAEAVDNKIRRVATDITRWSQDNSLQIKSAYVLKGKQTLRVEFIDTEPDDFSSKFKRGVSWICAGCSYRY